MLKGKLEDAENFLDEVSSNPENFSEYDSKWIEHSRIELFHAYCRVKDWDGAKRITKATKDVCSEKGRIAHFEQLSGMKYEENPEETYEKEVLNEKFSLEEVKQVEEKLKKVFGKSWGNYPVINCQTLLEGSRKVEKLGLKAKESSGNFMGIFEQGALNACRREASELLGENMMDINTFSCIEVEKKLTELKDKETDKKKEEEIEGLLNKYSFYLRSS